MKITKLETIHLEDYPHILFVAVHTDEGLIGYGDTFYMTDAVRGYVVRAGGRVLDPAPDCFLVELTASEAEINEFIADLAQHSEALEVVRSGALGVSRAGRSLRLVR